MLTPARADLSGGEQEGNNPYMRLYLCGSISDGDTASAETREANVLRFYQAEDLLFRRGFGVINPARRGHSGQHWIDYMRAALRDISECDGLALLNGWEKSRGARIEHDLAVSLGMPVKQVEAWLP